MRSASGETVQKLSRAGVDGALERSCGFLFLLKRGAVFFFKKKILNVLATVRVDVSTMDGRLWLACQSAGPQDG